MIKCIEIAKADISFGLRFVPLDIDSVRIAVFADASFACNSDLTSQLGFVIALADKTNAANILHYSSFKSKRVTRSFLSAELFALAHAFDIASTMRLTVNDMFGRRVPLTTYTDSKSL